MSDEQLPPTADESRLASAQQSIDDAKAAAAELHEPEEDELIEDGDAPVADDAEPADGPAPAA